MQLLPDDERFRFDDFEVDVAAAELKRNGRRIPIQDKPLRLLAYLSRRTGQVVSRGEIQTHLWPPDTTVVFEDGLNTAVKKLREALGDDSEKPRYIETVRGRGYRFLAAVEYFAPVAPAPRTVDAVAATEPEPASAAVPPEPPAVASANSDAPRPRRWAARLSLAAVLVLLAVGGAYWVSQGHPIFSFSARDSVLISDFENQTGDPRFDHALGTAFTISLEQSRHANVYPRGRIASVLTRMGRAANEKITPAVGREICQRENVRGLIVSSITRTGSEYALSAELVDPQSGDTIRSYSVRSSGEGHILDALDTIAADIRRDLGESLYEIHKNSKPLPEVTTSSLDALKQYGDGIALWRAGRYKDARAQYLAATTTDPNFAMAHAALGSSYYSFIFNEPEKGDPEFAKALALASRTTDRERMIIELDYADVRDHADDTQRLYRAYLARYPDDTTLRWNYARYLRAHDHVQESIEQYKQLLLLYPNDVNTLVELATCYSHLDHLSESIAAYSKAFEIDPAYYTTGNINREYGFVLAANGDYQKAESLFTSLLSNPPTREAGLRSLALLDMYRGKFAAAKPLLEESLARLRQLKDGQLGVMRVELLLAVQAAGEGDLRGQQEYLDAADALLKSISAKVILGAWIGSEYALAGKLRQAQEIESLIVPVVDSRSPEQQAYLHVLQAEIALKQGSYDKAIQLFSSAEAEKSTAYSAEGLARAYQQAGDMDHAIAQYEKFVAAPVTAISWEPQQRWVAAHYTLALDHLAQGNPAKAREALNPLVLLWQDADPNLPLHRQALELNRRLQ